MILFPEIPVLFVTQGQTPATVVAQGIAQGGNLLVRQWTMKYVAWYNQTWFHQDQANCSPPQIVAAWGVQAQAVFTRSAQMAAFLVAQGVNVPTSSPKDAAGNFLWLFTFNADGSMALAPNPAAGLVA